MKAGAMIGKLILITKVGVGFAVGTVWQVAQVGLHYFGIDIRKGLKDTVGNALGDGLNNLGNGIKNASESVGNALGGAWKNITGGFHFG